MCTVAGFVTPAARECQREGATKRLRVGVVAPPHTGA